MHILNAFSLNMIDPEAAAVTVRFAKMSRGVVGYIGRDSGLSSAIGHADTARIVSSLIGVDIPMKRESVVLRPGDVAIVAQYRGERLPEGATELPEGATLEFYLVEVM